MKLNLCFSFKALPPVGVGPDGKPLPPGVPGVPPGPTVVPKGPDGKPQKGPDGKVVTPTGPDGKPEGQKDPGGKPVKPDSGTYKILD